MTSTYDSEHNPWSSQNPEIQKLHRRIEGEEESRQLANNAIDMLGVVSVYAGRSWESEDQNHLFPGRALVTRTSDPARNWKASKKQEHRSRLLEKVGVDSEEFYGRTASENYTFAPRTGSPTRLQQQQMQQQQQFQQLNMATSDNYPGGTGGSGSSPPQFEYANMSELDQNQHQQHQQQHHQQLQNTGGGGSSSSSSSAGNLSPLGSADFSAGGRGGGNSQQRQHEQQQQQYQQYHHHQQHHQQQFRKSPTKHSASQQRQQQRANLAYLDHSNDPAMRPPMTEEEMAIFEEEQRIEQEFGVHLPSSKRDLRRARNCKYGVHAEKRGISAPTPLLKERYQVGPARFSTCNDLPLVYTGARGDFVRKHEAFASFPDSRFEEVASHMEERKSGKSSALHKAIEEIKFNDRALLVNVPWYYANAKRSGAMFLGGGNKNVAVAQAEFLEKNAV